MLELGRAAQEPLVDASLGSSLTYDAGGFERS
jgi:hypothetical protein